jgi:tRNA A37 N6-isopentenylltransferase MiaA
MHTGSEFRRVLPEYMARTCPLSRYARDVLELIDAVQVARTPIVAGGTHAEGL